MHQLAQNKISAPYGCWASRINSDLIVSAVIGFGTIVLVGSDVYWIETRPQEEGRHVIVRCNEKNEIRDAISREYNARSRVHEYGGGAYTVCDGIIYFSNFEDGRLYRQLPGKDRPEAITQGNKLRFADPTVDKVHNRIIAVCEDHTASEQQPSNTLVSISLADGSISTLVSGSDFYSSPRLSPDGKKLAWLNWNHPNMPWDATELWTADLDKAGIPQNKSLIAGNDKDESIAQPEWSPTGELLFVSDRNNWWNLYKFDGTDTHCLLEMQAEFAGAQWKFGYSYYAFIDNNRVICTYNQKGLWHLGIIDVSSGVLNKIDSDYTDVWWLKADSKKAVFRGGSFTKPEAIVKIDLDKLQFQELHRSSNIEIDLKDISIPESIAFPTDADCTAHGLFYKPQSATFTCGSNALPPLLVLCHGGPTGTAGELLNLEIQFWTTRGFAVLDVNYRGSTGYGRVYRDALKGKWGVADSQDANKGALYLVQQGLVDKNRLLIKGGSAGGLTVLNSLASGIFRAGASYFGVCDLEGIQLETHKFESNYLVKLVGRYPEERQVYLDRSPIHNVDKIVSPVIFFQGLQDKVVLPSQSESMVAALKNKGILVEYMPFPEEQHGFRGARAIKDSLDAELNFYSKVLNLARG